MRRSVTSLLLCLQFISASRAQQPLPSPPPPTTKTEPQKAPSPQQPTPIEDVDVVRITTNLVQIDAVVTDSKGRRVNDLRSDEVEMFEDGRSQKITNFSYIDLESKTSYLPGGKTGVRDKNNPPTPPVKLRPEQIRRTMALVVDDLGLSFESAYYVRRSLKKFIDEQMQPDDLVAIIRTGAGIGALQQFTSDRRQLYAATEKIRWNPSGRGQIAAFAPLGSNTNLESGGRTSEGDPDQFREDVFAVGTLGALQYVVKGLRELPGRKSVILFSDGFRIFNENDPFGNARLLAALRNLTDLANRASVVIYTIDPRGLQTLGLTAADSTGDMTAEQVEQSLSSRRNAFFDSQSGLAYLAAQTGGLTIKNSNDLNGGLKKIVADQEGYYLIGYRPDDSTFSLVNGRRKFHHISLKIKRDGKYKVRMRNGFYGVSDDEARATPKTAQQQMLNALTSPFGESGIHLRLTSLFANSQEVGSAMQSLLHVDARDLDFTLDTDGTRRAELDVVAVAFGDNGQVIDQFSYTQTLQIKDTSYQRLLNNGFTYTMTVPIKKPGGYQLRTVLRDKSSGKIGSASQFVEVPDIKKNRLLLSGVLLRGLPLETYLKGIGLITNELSSTGITTDNLPNSSPAVRQFKTGMALVYALTVYNAQINKASGKPNLRIQARLYRDGEQIFVGNETPFDPTDQTDLKRLTLGGGIQLGTVLTPGEYVLQIIVIDAVKAKPRIATQWMDFEIVE